MLVLPIGDENPNIRKPYVNYTLIVINILIFALFNFRSDYYDIVRQFGYIPTEAVSYTYLTSLFLHASWGHLLGNMLFLYITGDNVEDKLGHFGYLIFYLFCGAAACYAHGAIASPELKNIPTIGASGAISAVLGAYVLFFPKNKIKFFYFILIIIFPKWGFFRLTSFWAIGLWFLMQLFYHASSNMSPVAYGAHIGGFIWGAVICGLLVLTGVIEAHWHVRHGGFEDPLEEMLYEDRMKRQGFSTQDPYTKFNSPIDQYDTYHRYTDSA